MDRIWTGLRRLSIAQKEIFGAVNRSLEATAALSEGQYERTHPGTSTRGRRSHATAAPPCWLFGPRFTPTTAPRAVPDWRWARSSGVHRLLNRLPCLDRLDGLDVWVVMDSTLSGFPSRIEGSASVAGLQRTLAGARVMNCWTSARSCLNEDLHARLPASFSANLWGGVRRSPTIDKKRCTVRTPWSSR